MKHLFSVLAVAAVATFAFTFQSCQKNAVSDGGNGAVVIILKKHADSTLAVYRTFSGVIWKIGSETVSPAQNGSNIVTLDTCNTKVTYNFSALADSSYTVDGPITIHYFNSPCSAFLKGRSVDPDPAFNHYSVNLISANLSTLEFGDDGYDLVAHTYKIVSSSQKSLVLQITLAGYTYTKTYLPAQ